MNCQTCHHEIEELELGESLSDEASAHVGVCLPCGAFYNERLALRRLVGSLEPVSAPPDFEFRLRARLAANGNSGNHHSFWRSLIGAPAIGFAAAFALLVGGIVLYNQFKSAPVARDQASGTTQRDAAQKSETPKVNSPDTASAPKISEPGNQINPPLVTTPAIANSTNPHLAANKRGITRRQLRRSDSGTAPIVSNELAARGAPQITPGSGAQLTAEANHFVDLPVRSSARPVRVFVGDQSGGQRTVTLEPVIFGSQDLTGRNDSRRATSQGIW
jgi:hypothetical protein